MDYEWSSRRFLGTGDGMIDQEDLTAIIPIEAIKQKEKEIVQDRSLEPMAGRNSVYSDKDIVLMMRQFSGVKNTSDFQKMSMEEQRLLIEKLRGKECLSDRLLELQE